MVRIASLKRSMRGAPERLKVLPQSKCSTAPLQSSPQNSPRPASTPPPPASPPQSRPPVFHIHRGRSSPSTRQAAPRSPDAPRSNRIATSSSPLPPTAYSSAPRCPGAAHPASEKCTHSPPTAPPPESSPTPPCRRSGSSADRSPHWHAPPLRNRRATSPASYCCHASLYMQPCWAHIDAADKDVRPGPKNRTAESASPAYRSAPATHPPPA